MRIAHFSDLHVLALAGVGWSRYANKRITGVANLALRRAPLEELSGAWRAVAERVPSALRKKHFHRTDYVRLVAREIAREKVDHVVITGDITNLSLESEFGLAREILESELHLGPKDISIIPGNHDFYTRGALKNSRFKQFFAEYTHSEVPLPDDAHFPYVKLRGPCAIIGLCSAVPRAPFVAAGEIGRNQLDAFAMVLSHPEVQKRTAVILLHHPPMGPSSPMKMMMEGLRDGTRFVSRLRRVPRGLVLHGHLHTRMQSLFTTDAGDLHIVCSASASLHHDDTARMSGFNVYEIDDKTGAVGSIDARVLDADGSFHVEKIPEGRWD